MSAGHAWIIILLIAAMLSQTAPAQNANPQRELPAPILRQDGNTSSAKLYVFLPKNVETSCTAVVVCPGGAYARLAMEKEGFAVADWLNSIGVAAFVLEYRTELLAKPPLLDQPLVDAQWAVQTVRQQGYKWKVSNVVGILGFSAGGHLAATIGVNPEPMTTKTLFSSSHYSRDPSFMILVYPVISMTEELNHGGSRLRLIGEHPDQALVEKYSNELHVTAQTPPAFIVSGGEDASVNPENSIQFYRQLRANGVPAELHLFEKGRHGFGLAQNTTEPQSQWPALCEAWMRGRGLIR